MGKAAIAVAVCGFLAAGTLTAFAVLADVPENPGEPPTAVDEPAPPVLEALRPTQESICLVGAWRSVEDTEMIKFYTDAPPMRFTGSGRYLELRPGGIAVEQFSSYTASAGFSGRTLRVVSDGSMEYRWGGSDTFVQFYGNYATTLTLRYYDERGLIATRPPEQRTGILRNMTDYKCDATRFTETQPDGTRSVWARVVDTKVGIYG